MNVNEIGASNCLYVCTCLSHLLNNIRSVFNNACTTPGVIVKVFISIWRPKCSNMSFKIIVLIHFDTDRYINVRALSVRINHSVCCILSTELIRETNHSYVHLNHLHVLPLPSMRILQYTQLLYIGTARSVKEVWHMHPHKSEVFHKTLPVH